MYDIKAVSSAELAFLGDSVLEVLVREHIVQSPNKEAPAPRALRYVTAVAQSAALERILPLLTEEEGDVFRRGRNCVHGNIPKSASAAEYRRATGMECLFGWLWLCGDMPRCRELFAAAYADTEGESDGTINCGALPHTPPGNIVPRTPD